jgi:plasmid stabilization system protein ParE
MARVIVTASADRDTDEIVTYLAGRGGPPTVRKYLRLFDAVYERLQHFPRIGHPRPRLGLTVHIVIVHPYVMIYDWNAASGTVAILRIVRSSRRLTRKLTRA